MSELVHGLQAAGLLRPIDSGLALTLTDLDASHSETFSLLVALLSQATGNGHVCINLREMAGTSLKAEGAQTPSATVPPYEELLAVIKHSPLAGEPGDSTPLVLEDAERLYLGRYFYYEQFVADRLHKLSAPDAQSGIDHTMLAAALNREFTASGQDPDWQKVAAATALMRKLTVISGGPGTGKTHTVTAILALLIEQAGQQSLRLRLAAPTGKAAARLTESIRLARQHLSCSPELSERIPDEATTLHRLIGVRPGGSPRYRQDFPLPVDVLVVDEASMIDLTLMASVLAALPESARLILLGDKDQLASVEAGSVFADISGGQVEAAYSDAQVDALEKLAGTSLQKTGRHEYFGDSVVLLNRSYRFSSDSGIGALASAVNKGDAETALALLQQQQNGLSCRQLSAGEVNPALHDVLTSSIEDLFAAETPEQALLLLNRFRILCAVRRGPFGMEQINQVLESMLRRDGLIRVGQEHYRGRPVMITRNEHSLGLFNGDVGIVWPDTDGELRAWFPQADNTCKSVPLARLPEHETTWAMTVHKSQGSEFDQVLLVLPDQINPVLTRELLYTGISRARKTVEVWAGEQVLRHCVNTRVQRASGLGNKLWR